jgi:glutathione synthase/RimK-type ligase-like ATP-grasp enzyme
VTASCLVVVDSVRKWPFPELGADVVSARDYLSSDFPESKETVKLFNLCSNYRYQSLGYYVSLLAEARGHVPRPSVATIRDVRMRMVARSFAEDIDERVQSSLRSFETPDVCFRLFCGRTDNPALAKLAQDLYRLFPVPLMEARFTQKKPWRLSSLNVLTLNQLSAEEMDQFGRELAREIDRRDSRRPPGRRYLYDLAVVVDPDEPHPPSSPAALKKFTTAARDIGFYVETIGTGDIGRINEFDALFIRQTTAVTQPIYRLSRMAQAEGLVVVDDPWSILRAANKIYLTEILERAGIPAPGAWVLTRKTATLAEVSALPHPCVLKLPDGSFSRGVSKSASPQETLVLLEKMFTQSELILIQEFTPSDYDWRIGVLDRKPLFACKYYMARGHWQIYNWAAKRGWDAQSGRSEAVPLTEVPALVLDTALRAANLIGDGLYGVDIKQIGDEVKVIEVNDNPNIDTGVEDAVDGDVLYRTLARFFRERIEAARR